MKIMGLVHFCIIALAFWLGLLLFMEKSSNRKPASTTHQVYDYSDLDHKEFIEKTKIRVIEGAELLKENDKLKFRVGHVYGPTRSVSMCEKYARLVFAFRAEGIAVHGTPPSVYVAGDCKPSDNLSKTAELVLPYKQLTHSEPFEGSKKFENVELAVDHMDNTWPPSMYLFSISLVDPKTSDTIHINLSEIRKINRGNFTISFWD